MTSDDVLVLGWLLLAHLVADFVLQTDGIVADKQAGGARAWRGLGVHGAAVGVCLVPFAVVYGVRGLALLAAVTAGHVLIDRWKVGASRDAARRAAAAPARVGTADVDPAEIPEALGPAWTPVPAVLFVLDQVFHLALIGFAWLILLAPAQPTEAWVTVAERLTAGFPPDELHRAALVGVVIASLVIVNVRGGLFFVATLVGPGTRNGDRPVLEPPPPPPPLPAAWRVRVGPIEAVAQPARAERPVAPAVAPSAHASPARIGAAIGVLERLLIVAFVLAGQLAAIGFVIAAKTLARFKQLDDRDFAEYYLLGTLASVIVGVGSALVAQAALATL